MNYEKIHREAQHATAIEAVDRVILALRCCKQPFGCSQECPFAKQAEGLMYPIAYCQGMMVGKLTYVKEVLKVMEVKI